MGRILANVLIENMPATEKNLEFRGLVDTGATYITLPKAWREKFGASPMSQELEMATATGTVVKGELCGPFRVQIDRFRPIIAEILFTEMEKSPDDDEYEPLIGYIPLEQSCVAVDMLGHRLIKLKYFDLK